MRIFDLSPTLSARIGVFPGDVEFRRDRAMSFEAGHHLALSAVTTTLHVGSHADAPAHYIAEGEGIDRRHLALYIGRCWVAKVSVGRGERVTGEHLSAGVRAAIQNRKVTRLLVATSTFPNAECWNSDFASLAPELIHWCADHGVLLIGIDTPSIDPESSKQLEAHAAVAERNLAVLEGLCLNGIAEGGYFLSAAPLKIELADAGPVRAVLIEGLEVDVAADSLVLACEHR